MNNCHSKPRAKRYDNHVQERSNPRMQDLQTGGGQERAVHNEEHCVRELVCPLQRAGDKKRVRKDEPRGQEKPGQPSLYVGESARSGCTRAAEHWRDAEKGKEESHMIRHQECFNLLGWQIEASPFINQFQYGNTLL